MSQIFWGLERVNREVVPLPGPSKYCVSHLYGVIKGYPLRWMFRMVIGQMDQEIPLSPNAPVSIGNLNQNRI